MNKNVFTAGWLMAATAVLFSSCAKDDVIDIVDNGGPVQVINMTVANSGDNFLGTRAGDDRDLYSSTAQQKIENVKVVIYKLDVPAGTDINSDVVKEAMYGNKTIVRQKLFTDWMNGAVSSEYSTHGRQASWTLSGDNIIKDAGIYMAYAVGYNTANYTELSGFHNSAAGQPYQFPLSLTPAEADNVREIFAGATVFAITNEKALPVEGKEQPDAYTFNASLTLHRQVAGSVGYFSNIPIKGNKDHEGMTGEKLRLVAAGKNSKVTFAGFNSAFETQGNGVQYVVNGNTAVAAKDAKFYGSTQNDAYTVYEIDLKTWFPQMDSNGDGYLNHADKGWTMGGLTGINVSKGSVLAGSFIIPFQQVDNKPTFQLQLLSGDEIIRYWNIRLPEGTSESQKGKNVQIVDANGSVSTASAVESVFNYSIVRNHLYNIGLRNDGDKPTNPTDPTDPSQPENPDDKPQDLNSETLILKVNDNWEMIHQLDID